MFVYKYSGVLPNTSREEKMFVGLIYFGAADLLPHECEIITRDYEIIYLFIRSFFKLEFDLKRR